MNPTAAKSDLMVAPDHAEVFSKLKRRRVVLAECAVIGSGDETIRDVNAKCCRLIQVRSDAEFAEIGKIRGLLQDIRSIHAAAEAGDRAGANQVRVAKNKLLHAKRRRARIQGQNVLAVVLTRLIEA